MVEKRPPDDAEWHRELTAIRAQIGRLLWRRAEHPFSSADQARYDALCRREEWLLHHQPRTEPRPTRRAFQPVG
jgi:hypothetical protein